MSEQTDKPMEVQTTVLLTDLVGSTRLIDTVGNLRASEIFEREEEEGSRLIKEFHGKEIDRSDGVLCVFSRTIDAVRFSLSYHEKLRTLSEELDETLQARVGLHLGDVVQSQTHPGRIHGLPKPIAARICALAIAGQTLLSRAAHDVAKAAARGARDMPPDTRWEVHGEYALKGTKEHIVVCEVGREGVAPFKRPPGRIGSGQPGADGGAKAREEANRGIRCAANNDWKCADDHYRACRAIQHDDADAYFAQAYLALRLYDHSKEGHYADEGLRFASRWTEIQPDVPRAWNLKGVFHKIRWERGRQQEEWNKAYDSYLQAIEIEEPKPTQYTEPWVNIGTLLALDHQIPEAERWLENAVKRLDIACDVRRHYVDAWRHRAAVHVLNNEWIKAGNLLGKARAQDPTDIKTMRLLILLYIVSEDSHDPTTALVSAKDALVGLPDDGLLLRLAAWASLDLQQWDEAIAYSKRAVAQNDWETINYLIMSIAEAEQVLIAEAKPELLTRARSHRDRATDNWPSDFDAHNAIVTAKDGELWFERRADWEELRDQADALLKGP
ncbi:MAG: hypothetical protein IH988_04145 [Planctomycetes bacterium]|nr:hypothetical protein [Planctomycetota bacterium]